MFQEELYNKLKEDLSNHFDIADNFDEELSNPETRNAIYNAHRELYPHPLTNEQLDKQLLKKELDANGNEIKPINEVIVPETVKPKQTTEQQDLSIAKDKLLETEKQKQLLQKQVDEDNAIEKKRNEEIDKTGFYTEYDEDGNPLRFTGTGQLVSEDYYNRYYGTPSKIEYEFPKTEKNDARVYVGEEGTDIEGKKKNIGDYVGEMFTAPLEPLQNSAQGVYEGGSKFVKGISDILMPTDEEGNNVPYKEPKEFFTDVAKTLEGGANAGFNLYMGTIPSGIGLNYATTLANKTPLKPILDFGFAPISSINNKFGGFATENGEPFEFKEGSLESEIVKLGDIAGSVALLHQAGKPIKDIKAGLKAGEEQYQNLLKKYAGDEYVNEFFNSANPSPESRKAIINAQENILQKLDVGETANPKYADFYNKAKEEISKRIELSKNVDSNNRPIEPRKKKRGFGDYFTDFFKKNKPEVGELYGGLGGLIKSVEFGSKLIADVVPKIIKDGKDFSFDTISKELKRNYPNEYEQYKDGLKIAYNKFKILSDKQIRDKYGLDFNPKIFNFDDNKKVRENLDYKDFSNSERDAVRKAFNENRLNIENAQSEFRKFRNTFAETLLDTRKKFQEGQKELKKSFDEERKTLGEDKTKLEEFDNTVKELLDKEKETFDSNFEEYKKMYKTQIKDFMKEIPEKYRKTLEKEKEDLRLQLSDVIEKEKTLKKELRDKLKEDLKTYPTLLPDNIEGEEYIFTDEDIIKAIEGDTPFEDLTEELEAYQKYVKERYKKELQDIKDLNLDDVKQEIKDQIKRNKKETAETVLLEQENKIKEYQSKIKSLKTQFGEKLKKVKTEKDSKIESLEEGKQKLKESAKFRIKTVNESLQGIIDDIFDKKDPIKARVVNDLLERMRKVKTAEELSEFTDIVTKQLENINYLNELEKTESKIAKIKNLNSAELPYNIQNLIRKIGKIKSNFLPTIEGRTERGLNFGSIEDFNATLDDFLKYFDTYGLELKKRKVKESEVVTSKPELIQVQDRITKIENLIDDIRTDKYLEDLAQTDSVVDGYLEKGQTLREMANRHYAYSVAKDMINDNGGTYINEKTGVEYTDRKKLADDMVENPHQYLLKKAEQKTLADDDFLYSFVENDLHNLFYDFNGKYPKDVRDKFSKTDKENYDKLKDIAENHLGELTGQQATLLSRIIQNKIVNGKFIGVKEFFRAIDTEKQLNEAVSIAQPKLSLSNKKGTKWHSNLLSYAQANAVLQGDAKIASKLSTITGMHDLSIGESKSVQRINKFVEDWRKYIGYVKRNGFNPMTERNQIQQTFLSRAIAYDPIEQSISEGVKKAKVDIETSINNLLKPENSQELQDKGALYKEEYDKILPALNDVIAKNEITDLLKKNENYEVVKTAVDFVKTTNIAKELENISNDYFNKEFIALENYTPSTISQTLGGAKDIPSVNTIRPSTNADLTGRATKRTKSLGENKYLNGDFTDNLINGLYESIYDVETMDARNKLENFYSNSNRQLSEVYGNNTQADFMRKMTAKTIDTQLGRDFKHPYATMNNVAILNKITRVAYKTILGGGFLTYLKQSIPVFARVALTTGMDNTAFGLKMAYLENNKASTQNYLKEKTNLGLSEETFGGFDIGKTVKGTELLNEKDAQPQISIFLEKNQKRISDASDKMLTFLKKGDTASRRVIYFAYLAERMKELGHENLMDDNFLDNIQSESLPENIKSDIKESEAYAQSMVDRFQTSTSESMNSLFAHQINSNPLSKTIRNLVSPYSTFALNKMTEQYLTNTRVEGGGKQFGGMVGEIATFNVIKTLVSVGALKYVADVISQNVYNNPDSNKDDGLLSGKTWTKYINNVTYSTLLDGLPENLTKGGLQYLSDESGLLKEDYVQKQRNGDKINVKQPMNLFGTFWRQDRSSDPIDKIKDIADMGGAYGNVVNNYADLIYDLRQLDVLPFVSPKGVGVESHKKYNIKNLPQDYKNMYFSFAVVDGIRVGLGISAQEVNQVINKIKKDERVRYKKRFGDPYKVTTIKQK